MMFTNLLSGFQNIPTIFFNVNGRDVLDMMVIAFFTYIVLLFVKQTRSYFIIYIALILFGISFLSQNLNLTLTREVFQQISTITFIILVVAFQRELRRFFKWIISGKTILTEEMIMTKSGADEIAQAILFMAKKRIGGIFVFPGAQNLDDMIEGGQELNGRISEEIILSIFDTSSAGHDGAIVIDENKIQSFGVHLPLARDYDNYRKAGTRHRAATGITEGSDALAIVISEERGAISLAKNGKLKLIKDEKALLAILKTITHTETEETRDFWYYFFVKNFGTKGIAVACSMALWVVVTLETGIASKDYTLPLSFQLLPEQYEVDPSISTETVTVTLQGRNQDLVTFDATKLDVKVDAKQFTLGEQEVLITESMISVPPYLRIVDLTPDEILVPVREKTLKEPPKILPEIEL